MRSRLHPGSERGTTSEGQPRKEQRPPGRRNEFPEVQQLLPFERYASPPNGESTLDRRVDAVGGLRSGRKN